ncbi:unnamed protein product [Lasius platythorax]|uniref:Uncharacterized protein n=1 Tax=Lasius platythorax TaxID=488582 RepID=A0AAV2NUI1_9HYME
MTAEVSKKRHIAHSLAFAVHISIVKDNSGRLLSPALVNYRDRCYDQKKSLPVACGNAISDGKENVLAAQ